MSNLVNKDNEKKDTSSLKDKSREKQSLESKQKGERLKLLRKMAHLSMKELAQLCNLGLTTINYWEQGYSSITERGAKKVSKALREEGIECSVIWLLSGYGEHPKITNPDKLAKLTYKTIKSDLLFSQTIHDKNPDYPLENSEIRQELALFKKNYPKHLVHFVADESMKPLYAPGDLVAGKKLIEKNMELAHGADCIVELEEKKLLIRRVKITNAPNYFDLYVINSDASLEFPPLRNVKLSALAPIIRVWKPTKF